VTLLRKAGHREIVVAAMSSLLFAASHAVNIFSGQAPVAVALTVVYTFFFGIGLYLTLRVTRNLIWPILLHASTDPSGILLAGGIDSAGGAAAQTNMLTSIAGTANLAVIFVGLLSIWFIRGRVAAGSPGDVDRAGRREAGRESREQHR
jgi:hypothetical protein